MLPALPITSRNRCAPMTVVTNNHAIPRLCKASFAHSLAPRPARLPINPSPHKPFSLLPFLPPRLRVSPPPHKPFPLLTSHFSLPLTSPAAASESMPPPQPPNSTPAQAPASAASPCCPDAPDETTAPQATPDHCPVPATPSPAPPSAPPQPRPESQEPALKSTESSPQVTIRIRNHRNICAAHRICPPTHSSR
jgi:hypothetical protein